MIRLTPQERKILWEEYPEVQELYEEYNSILLEDNGAWGRIAERCCQIREQHQTGPECQGCCAHVVCGNLPPIEWDLPGDEEAEI